jgi:hypothetical protein
MAIEELAVKVLSIYAAHMTCKQVVEGSNTRALHFIFGFLNKRDCGWSKVHPRGWSSPYFCTNHSGISSPSIVQMISPRTIVLSSEKIII